MSRQEYSSRKPGQPVCRCGKGYGSKYDGLCLYCRGKTAWQAQMDARGMWDEHEQKRVGKALEGFE